MHRDGETTVIMGNYKPGQYIIDLIESARAESAVSS